jgi:hypothetical protein
VGGSFAIPIGKSNPGVQISQTFTAEIGGTLQAVSIAAVCTDRDLSVLNLAVASLINGQPGAVLASAPLTGLGINGQFPDIKTLNALADFSHQQVVLQPEQQYALLFIPNISSASFQVLGDQTVGTTRDYPGGQILRSVGGNPFQLFPGGDLVFEVVVTPVPEPAALYLMLMAPAIARGLRRKV